MKAKIKFSKEERQYWCNVLIAASQISFGLGWASIFLPPIDVPKAIVIILNLLMSTILWIGGWFLIRKKK